MGGRNDKGLSFDEQKIIDSIPAWQKRVVPPEASEGSQAMRYNKGKPQYSLVDLSMLEPLVRVLEYGANKYARYNYQKGFNQSQLIDSMLRHIADLIEGKTVDEESGQLIIGHIMANAMFLGCKKNINDLEKK